MKPQPSSTRAGFNHSARCRLRPTSRLGPGSGSELSCWSLRSELHSMYFTSGVSSCCRTKKMQSCCLARLANSNTVIIGRKQFHLTRLSQGRGTWGPCSHLDPMVGLGSHGWRRIEKKADTQKEWARGGGGGLWPRGGGSPPVRSLACCLHLFGKGGLPAGLPCGSQIPKFSTSSALLASVRGGTSLAMCQPVARAKVVLGAW